MLKAVRFDCAICYFPTFLSFIIPFFFVLVVRMDFITFLVSTYQLNELCNLLCMTGDAYVQTTEVLEAVFINSGDNPFELIQNSIKYVKFHNYSVMYLLLQFCHFEVDNGELL